MDVWENYRQRRALLNIAEIPMTLGLGFDMRKRCVAVPNSSLNKVSVWLLALCQSCFARGHDLETIFFTIVMQIIMNVLGGVVG